MMNAHLPGMEPPTPEPGYVYIGTRYGQLKIGWSRNPHRRARELGLTLLWWEPGSPKDEQALHRRFRHDRTDREWFMPSPAILRYITEPPAAA